MRKLIPAMACLMALVGCKPAWLPMPTVEQAGKIVDQAESSFTSGDPVRIMEHYAPDAVIFDPGQNEPTRDRAVATKWTESFVAMKPSSFSPGKRHLQILGDHTIISAGVATMTVEGKSGPEKMQVRYTDVYKQQPDRTWLIVHEHLSQLPVPNEAADGQ